MQITITGQRLWQSIGWILGALFWVGILFLIIALTTARGDSGAGYVVMGLGFAALVTFPALAIPIGILVYGLRKEHAVSLPRVLYKWGTIASMTYVAILVLSLAFMLNN